MEAFGNFLEIIVKIINKGAFSWEDVIHVWAT